jgi:hypothetical protein
MAGEFLRASLVLFFKVVPPFGVMEATDRIFGPLPRSGVRSSHQSAFDLFRVAKRRRRLKCVWRIVPR